jgi:hypothetical protein
MVATAPVIGLGIELLDGDPVDSSSPGNSERRNNDNIFWMPAFHSLAIVMAPANAWMNIDIGWAPEVLEFMIMEVDLIGFIFFAVKDQSFAEGAGDHENRRMCLILSTTLSGVTF